MIDPNVETLISLTEAARGLPRRRRGKKPALSTLYRWTVPPGCRGIILESIQVGGTRCTSPQAISRFFHRLTDPAQHGLDQPETPRQHHRRREREVAAAVRELEREGL